MEHSVDHTFRIDAHLKGLVRDVARYTNLPLFVMRVQTCGVDHSLWTDTRDLVCTVLSRAWSQTPTLISITASKPSQA